MQYQRHEDMDESSKKRLLDLRLAVRRRREIKLERFESEKLIVDRET